MTAASQPAGAPGTFTIGEVLKRLRGEFPEVTASRIRFYEDKGLVTPRRTAAKYRKYSEADVERLLYVLRAKRDHFLPLDVIREHLDKMDRGLMPTIQDVTPVVPPGAGEIPVEPGVQPARVALTADEVIQATNADVRLLNGLEEHGLVRPDASGLYRDDAIAIIRAAVALRELGLEPRHLRPLRVSAERTVGLVERVVTPELSRSEGKDRAMDQADTITGIALTLQTALVRAGVNQMLA